MPSPSDSRRLPLLTTSSPGGDPWQQSDYGMPTAHRYPNIRSPTASYPTTYVTYPSSNQTNFYSYHLPTNDHHLMGVPDHRSLFDETKGPWASSEKASEKGPGTRRGGGRWYSIPHGGDERHASPVSASLRFTPIPSLAPPSTARAQRTMQEFSHAGDNRHHSSSHIGRKSSFANDGRSGFHNFITRKQREPSPPHSADSGWGGLIHSSSNNGYQESHKDRKHMRHYTSLSPSGFSRYHIPPSLAPRTGSGGYLQDVNSFDGRERLDHVWNSDVKSDHRPNCARQSLYLRAVWDASERDTYDGLYSYTKADLILTLIL